MSLTCTVARITLQGRKSYDQCKIKTKNYRKNIYVNIYIYLHIHTRRRRVNARVTRVNPSILALLLCERTPPCTITFLCYIATDVRLAKWIDLHDVRITGRLDADAINSKRLEVCIGYRRCKLRNKKKKKVDCDEKGQSETGRNEVTLYMWNIYVCTHTFFKREKSLVHNVSNCATSL